MDPLTHAVSGVALARALPKHPPPRLHVMLLAGLAMLPDADYILRLISDSVYLQYHRGVTHSLLMLPLWVWLIHSLLRNTRPTIPAWLIAVVIAMHIGLDVITSFGTMILAPFSDWRAALDLIFIIDPLFTACFLLPLLLARLFPRQARPLALASLLLSAGYLGMTAWAHQQAVSQAKTARPDARTHAALPLPFSPFHWQIIAGYRDHYARAGLNLMPAFPGCAPFFPADFSRLYMQSVRPSDKLEWQELPPMQAVAGIKKLPGVRFYQWFARFPVLLERDQRHLLFGDLRFGAGADGVNTPFSLRIDTTDRAKAWLLWRADRRSPLP